MLGANIPRNKKAKMSFDFTHQPPSGFEEPEDSVIATYEYDKHQQKMPFLTEHPDLSWRTDPQDSLSDWTIKITNMDDNNVTTYHVHKNFLGAGSRRSGYFDRLFKLSQQVEELKTCRSNISFRGAATVNAIPEMLDHIYTGQCNFSSSNVAALRYLANYFVIPTLHVAVGKFMECDLFPATAQVYLAEAEPFNDVTVEEMVYNMYAKCLHSLTTTELCSLRPEELLRIITSSCGVFDSETLSKQIATYFNHHPECLSREVLDSLTDESFMPIISAVVALPLLKLAIQHAEDEQPSALGVALSSMNSLKKRCVRACAANWEEALGTASFMKAMNVDGNNNNGREVEIIVDADNGGESVKDEFLDLPDSLKVEILQLALTSCNHKLKQYRGIHSSRRMPSVEEDIGFRRRGGPRIGFMLGERHRRPPDI